MKLTRLSHILIFLLLTLMNYYNNDINERDEQNSQRKIRELFTKNTQVKHNIHENFHECELPQLPQLHEWVLSSPSWITNQPSLCITSLVIPRISPRSKINWQIGPCTTKGSVKRICLLLLLILSGDIQSHPGPNTSMCSICDNEINPDHTSLRCSACDKWSHINCENATEQLPVLGRWVYWECPSCSLPNLCSSKFSQSDLEISNDFSLLGLKIRWMTLSLKT